jgi:hypothetical protein
MIFLSIHAYAREVVELFICVVSKSGWHLKCLYGRLANFFPILSEISNVKYAKLNFQDQ